MSWSLGMEFFRILYKEHKGMKVGELLVVVVFVILVADVIVVREI
jgi:hypothetical protein